MADFLPLKFLLAAFAHPVGRRNGLRRGGGAHDGNSAVAALSAGRRRPGATLMLLVHRKDGSTEEVPVTCRLDTAEEVSIYEAGGVLQRFAQDFLAGQAEAVA